LDRSLESELIESANVPQHLVERAYRDLTRIHRLLRDTAAVAKAIRRNPFPVRRILDIGCGHGGVLRDLRRRLTVEVVGVDLRPPKFALTDVPIICADAVRDPLPTADLAFSMNVGHHLSPEDLAALMRNVGRYCRRFFLLDLVRHPLPLALFRIFVAPLVSRLAAADGKVSVRRSYTPAELRDITAEAIAGAGASFRHHVSPFYIRQSVDIWYAPVNGTCS
jgi:SAM-dependent methyltransferase